MSTFASAIPIILRHEGGYVNNPADPGGATNWGISTLIIEEWHIEAKDLGIPDLSPESIKAMPQDAAVKVYKRIFWDPYLYERILDQRMATKVFDCAVNIGPKRAHRLAQYACNACGQHLDTDGILGPIAFSALNVVNPLEWMPAMCEEMRHYYDDLMFRKPALRVFGDNWMRRAAWSGEGLS
jgi:lysozyme family protein